MKRPLGFAKLAARGACKRSAGKIPVAAAAVCLLFCFFAAPVVHADGQDLDAYKVRVTAFWWFSEPSGFFNSQGNTGSFDIARDLGSHYYSTFSGRLDWRFKRKHHLLFGVSPVEMSKTTTLTRAISFQGDTFDIGVQVASHIQSLSFAPGYQYDIIRRNHGYLGILAQINLLDTSASLTGAAAVNGEIANRKASGSVFAPLPVFGPRGRWYPLHNSGRLALEGFIQGMYFFGYGNFMTAGGNVGVALSRHWRLAAGYQMGSRLSIHGTSNQIGIRLTQKGPVAGVEASW